MNSLEDVQIMPCRITFLNPAKASMMLVGLDIEAQHDYEKKAVDFVIKKSRGTAVWPSCFGGLFAEA